MNSGIYRILSIATGESYYGSSKNLSRRLIEHKYKWRNNRGNHKIRELLKIYGIDNFKFEILEFCSPDKFNEKEKIYIESDQKRLNVWILPFAAKGCNLGNSVKGKKYFGTPHTEETKKNQSRIMKEYYSNNEGYWKGKSLSEETKMKLSKGLKEYFTIHDHPNKGKHLSEETRIKISESLKKRGAL